MDTYTNGMTLEEQIGQALMVGFWGHTPSQDIIDLISRYHIGNVILFSRNIGNTRQVLELTQSLQRIAKEAGHPYPLLIVCVVAPPKMLTVKSERSGRFVVASVNVVCAVYPEV